MKSKKIEALKTILDGDVEETERILKTMSKDELHSFRQQLGWLRDIVDEALVDML